MSTPADNQAMALRELAMAQQAKLDAIEGDFGTLKKATIVALESEGAPAVTINLSGNDDVDIPGVHYLDYYAPVIGDTVLVTKQGGELLVIGVVAGGTSFADGTWTQMTLASGWAHDVTGANGGGPVMYRRVIDHGAVKIQWQGTAVRSSGGGTITTILPEGFRPSSRRIFMAPRYQDQAATSLRLHFNPNGLVTYSGGILNTAASTTTHIHPISVALSSPYDHFHTGNTGTNSSGHSHLVSDEPDWVEFNGAEYFI